MTTRPDTTAPEGEGASDEGWRLTEPETVEITVKVKLELPAGWITRNRTERGKVSNLVREKAFDILDNWQVQDSQWIGEGPESRQVFLDGHVSDVEIDAGDWGYYAISEKDDDRLGLYITVVPK